MVICMVCGVVKTASHVTGEPSCSCMSPTAYDKFMKVFGELDTAQLERDEALDGRAHTEKVYERVVRERNEAIADRDRYATLIENLKFDREEALAQVEQWRRINEGREYVITSYRIGQPSYADKGMTMIDEAREKLLKILARRARRNIKAKGSHPNGSTST